jgi:anti-sigma factor RsiW
MPEKNDEAQPNELIAYLDGELSGKAREDMERRLSADQNLRREADELKRSWDLLDYLPQAEPSPAFASRTLERLSVARPAATAARNAVAASPTITHIESPGSPWPRRLAISAAALVILGIGYLLPGAFIKKTLPELTQSEMEEQMARDLRVIDHLNLYQHGDEMGFVAGLDQPDLFGDAP